MANFDLPAAAGLLLRPTNIELPLGSGKPTSANENIDLCKIRHDLRPYVAAVEAVVKMRLLSNASVPSYGDAWPSMDKILVELDLRTIARPPFLREVLEFVADYKHLIEGDPLENSKGIITLSRCGLLNAQYDGKLIGGVAGLEDVRFDEKQSMNALIGGDMELRGYVVPRNGVDSPSRPWGAIFVGNPLFFCAMDPKRVSVSTVRRGGGLCFDLEFGFFGAFTMDVLQYIVRDSASALGTMAYGTASATCPPSTRMRMLVTVTPVRTVPLGEYPSYESRKCMLEGITVGTVLREVEIGVMELHGRLGMWTRQYCKMKVLVRMDGAEDSEMVSMRGDTMAEENEQ